MPNPEPLSRGRWGGVVSLTDASGYSRLQDGAKGRINFAGKSEIRKVREEVGMVFQRFNLFPHMTALENVVEAPMAVKGIDKAAAKTRALELLDSVGLSHRADHYPLQMSGGQQQRVAIARALAMDPRVMLFDDNPPSHKLFAFTSIGLPTIDMVVNDALKPGDRFEWTYHGRLHSYEYKESDGYDARELIKDYVVFPDIANGTLYGPNRFLSIVTMVDAPARPGDER